MAFSFWNIFTKGGRQQLVEVGAQDLFDDAANDFRIRELALNICINKIANAIGRCDFRTFTAGREIFDELWYRWNVEPNGNQNSTAFLHKLIYKLCTENEALIISQRRRSGGLDMLVADSWKLDGGYTARQNEYHKVKVGKVEYDKTFRESDVLHLTLNHADIAPVLTALYASYKRMISVAVSAYEYGAGQHWKVKVERMQRGDAEMEARLKKILTEDIRNFLRTPIGAIAEYDGFSYQDLTQKSGNEKNLEDLRKLFSDVYQTTAQAFGIPVVLMTGQVEGTKDATQRFLTDCIDPICDQLQEEIQRKEFSFDEFKNGDFIRVDSSAISHFDLFDNAANVEKLIGSGAYSINDVRRAANQPRIPEAWADEHYMTLNIEAVADQTRPLA